MDLVAVRSAIRAERKRRRWSLDDLAEASGVNRSAIHAIETNDKGKPQFETIAKIVEGLGFALADFLARIDSLPTGGTLVQDPPPQPFSAVIPGAQHGADRTIQAIGELEQVTIEFKNLKESIAISANAILGKLSEVTTTASRRQTSTPRRRKS